MYPNPFKPGDILLSVWGTTMTLVSYYEVMSTTPQYVKIARLHTLEVGDGGFLTGTSTPVRGKHMTHHDGTVCLFTRRVRDVDDASYVRGEHECERAYLWNGTPASYNHCD